MLTTTLFYFLFLPGIRDSFPAYDKSLLLKWSKRWYQECSWVIVTSSLPLSLEVSFTMPLALSLPLLPIQCGVLAPSAPLRFSQGRAGESSACLSHFSAKELWAEWYKMNGFPDSAKIYAKHVFYEMTHCKEELCYCSWRDFSEEKSRNFASGWLCLGSLPVANWTLSKVQNNPSKRHVWCFMGPLRKYF